MSVKYVVGLFLAFSIGAVCRLANVPVPAPPAIVGALLVVSITLGYELGGRLRGDES